VRPSRIVRAASTLAAACAVAAALPGVASAGLSVAVTTASPKDITTTTATLRANVLLSALGGSIGFQYGTTSGYGLDSASVSTGLLGAAQEILVPVTGLRPSTTYHVRAAVTSGLLPTYGADVTFTTGTPAAPPVDTDDSGSGTGSGTSGSGSSGSGSGTSGSGTSGSGTSGSGTKSGGSKTTSGTKTTTKTTASSDGTDDTPGNASPAEPTATVAPTPALGKTVGLEALDGDVSIISPSGAVVDLSVARALPTGTIVDTTNGTVELTTALDRKGNTQVGRFWGGVFQIRQSPGAKGLTELVLTGGDFSSCTATAARVRAKTSAVATAAKAKKKKAKAAAKPSRSLWGSDNHGRFQTRGRGSVATVRGTQWFTQDTCDGTLTRVVKGTVSVLDLHRKHATTVRHGHEYLARLAAR
jgi:hypothetical protein